MTTWLTKQRKGDLQQLAVAAEIPGYDELLKDDLVSTLDEKLRSNASSYSSNPVFREYYGRTGSPIKKERQTSATFTADGEKPQRRRRQTLKAKEELDSPGEESTTDITTLATRTPRAVQRVAQRIPLPPSPQVVTDMIVRGQANIGNKINTAWKKSGTTEFIESVRDTSSTVVGVQLAALLTEAWGLQRVTFPWKYAFHVPVIRNLNAKPIDVALPDFFNLLKIDFWAPSTLWLTTSIFLPLLFAYFFNFTHSLKSRSRTSPGSQYKVDPFTFSIVRALATYIVYAQGVTGGIATPETVAVVNGAFPGGYGGVLIGAGIGALASLYDAILQKH